MVRCVLIMMFVLLLFVKLCSCGGNSNNSSWVKLGCKPSERKALLNFKHSLTGLNDHFVWSTWEDEDCCSWRRVRCDPATGHVVQLHLHGFSTDYGQNVLFKAEELGSSLQHLLELNHLEHLDVSINNFTNTKIPKVIGSMKQLRYLNLSCDAFSEVVPHQLGNLTKLQVLDLAYNDRLIVDSLQWVTNLRELRYLDLEYADLSQVHDWVDSLIYGPFPSLRELHLSNCHLSTYPTHSSLKNSSLPNPPIRYLGLSNSYLDGEFPHFIQNLTSLDYLDLALNDFESEIPLWLGKLKSLIHLHLMESGFEGIEGGNLWGVVRSLCSLKSLVPSINELQGNLLEPHVNSSTTNCTHFALEYLNLSENQFISGHIAAWLGEEFRSLKSLSLGYNNISGVLPKSLGMLSSMVSLDISYNNISGKIPTSLGALSSIETLDISYNPLDASVLSESHFVNLSSLTKLYMSHTFLTMKLPSDWVPPFQLLEWHADSIKINGPFPQWIKTQKTLNELILINANIHGVLPKWFHKMDSLYVVDLSNNHITGCPIFPIQFSSFGISNNSISCLCFTNDSLKDSMYNNASVVDLSYNNISGKLPENLYDKMPSLTYIILSNNKINGSIPKSMCLFTSLEILDLQTNRLSGTLPDCLNNSVSLENVYLSSNKLSRNIPCFNPTSKYLHLNDNLLSGELPSCLANLSGLTVLDLGDNELSGETPMWLKADYVSNLQILRLRNNKLKGNVRKQLCSLTQLQLLDFGHNFLTGTIPNCLSNLTGMIDYVSKSSYEEADGVSEVIKGILRRYTTNLGLLVSIDLSCNNLVGSIPDGITNLQSMINLNLSYNQLTGVIC